METPMITFLSKADLLEDASSSNRYQLELPTMEYYLDPTEALKFLFSDEISSESNSYSRLTNAIIDLVNDLSLLSFDFLAVQNKQSMRNVIIHIDSVIGYSDDTPVVQ